MTLRQQQQCFLKEIFFILGRIFSKLDCDFILKFVDFNFEGSFFFIQFLFAAKTRHSQGPHLMFRCFLISKKNEQQTVIFQ